MGMAPCKLSGVETRGQKRDGEILLTAAHGEVKGKGDQPNYETGRTVHEKDGVLMNPS
jgi:hypothetical protein